ncbi:uncharacterized protein LOC110975844 [Acanthaster planci]|uniref:Uncharacterized protein LOC110975844 n=1 Tax=Acanthaster planci TaxID=133434 RepID=A0A8B7XU44_ACAPL|nr:uncharacterized protein LOC110975844 [Acanthaster planci]
MAFLHRKATRALSILLVCTALIGWYVQLHHKGKENQHAKHSKDETPVISEDTRPSDVTKSSRSNSAESAKTDKEPVKKIDTETKIGQTAKRSATEKHLIDLDNMDPEELFNRTAIVTAISQNHLRESKGMIGSVQEILPHRKIILYDLGLTPRGVEEVKRLCNVELRKFNFSKYPPHVSNLFKYAWKPLIIRDMLEEFGVVFWGDAAARLQKHPGVLFPVLKEQKGFMAIVEQYGSSKMLARTHPKMFGELQIDMNKFVKDDGYALCMEGNRLLFANTALIQTKIIEPWVECALREHCIAPEGGVRGINVKGPVKHTHRFDQAALALVTYRNLRGLLHRGNDQSKLFSQVAGLSRSTKGAEKAKYCKA